MVGQNIGKYRVLDRVGRGGMGTVYRAIDETLHREVAIKVLNAELNDPEVAKRFRAEAITVARLSHPGIATIYELFQHEGQWLMVMEFVRGETLERLVERTGAQSPDRAAELCMQSLAALAHAHSMGVVHRDLKPANIMVTETGTVKIMDFGIARVTGSEHLTNVGFMMGTPAYMAPEQVLGHEIDARADIYAMGVVFYRLVTAQLPFKGETPFAMAQAQVNNPPTPVSTFRADLPVWVEQVMTRSLAKKPEDRFQSAVEFHEGFARCLTGQPMSADYSSSAPTGLMMTPPRAMPSGAIDRTMISTPLPAAPTRTSGSHPMPPASDGVDIAPTMAGTPVSTVRPATGPQPMTAPAEGPDSGAMATVLAPSTAAMRASTDGMKEPTPVTMAGPSVVANAAASGAPAAAKAAKAAPAKKGSGGLIAAAVVVVALAGGGVFWMRSRPAPPPAPAVADVPPVVTDPAPIDPSVSAAPPASGQAGPAVPAAPAVASTAPKAPGAVGAVVGATPAPTGAARAGAPGVPAAPADPAASAIADAGRRGTPPATAPAAPGRSARGPVDDTHVALTDVKLLVVNGKKTKDEDVLVSFVGGQVSILAKKDSAPIATWPYRSVTRATYVKARDPKWDASLASPPDGLDVGGVLRTSKHWFVMQNKDAYLILRMSDQNYARIIETVEARSGIAVARPSPDADKK